MKEVQLDVKRTGQQKKAWEALAKFVVDRLMYGGAKGGGKSWFLCVWLFTMVWIIMVAAKLKPSKNPPHVAWFGRKQATDLTSTTLQTWREVIPEEYYVLRGATEKDPKHILIADRIAIDYGGLDKQENINKFNSAEYIIICVDQAEEVSKDDISTVIGSLRMVLKVDGKPVVPRDENGKIIIDPLTGKPYDHWPFKELYTANPRQCWLKNDFILNPKDNVRFIPALPTDNPHLPAGYIQKLEDAFGHRPELLRAYRDGDWSAIEDAEQVILDVWLDNAMHRRGDYWPFVKEYIAIDCARFGDDETVMLLMSNTDIKEKIVMPHCRTTDISGRAAALSTQNGKCHLVVESTGSDLGAGVVDELIEMDYDVLIYNPQGKPTDKEKYYNVRAEAWSDAAKVLCSGVLDKHSNCGVCLTRHGEGTNYGLDDVMRGQLCTPHYKFRRGKIIIEKKEDIKKRLGRSPDHADAYVIALWAWPFMPKKEEKKTTYRKRRQAVGSAMEF